MHCGAKISEDREVDSNISCRTNDQNLKRI